MLFLNLEQKFNIKLVLYFLQPDHDEPRLVSRSGYSAAEDYPLDRNNYRLPPLEDQQQYRSPPRRTAVPEAPRAAPRRSRYNDASPPPPELSLRAHNDYKRRSATYGYEDVGGDCCPPSYGGRRGGESSLDIQTADDDGLPPTALAGREYKRRSAAYAYEDHQQHHHQHQHGKHHHQNHQHLQQDHGGGYSRREMMADKRAAQAEDSSSPISPRYRHSYAEAYHRHQPPPPPQESVYRHNGSLQSSGRIGIAAIHPY